MYKNTLAEKLEQGHNIIVILGQVVSNKNAIQMYATCSGFLKSMLNPYK